MGSVAGQVMIQGVLQRYLLEMLLYLGVSQALKHK
jgi:hypothetical protein